MIRLLTRAYLAPVRLADWWRTDAEYLLAGLRASPWGLAALAAARTTVGWGESGGNNRGARVEQLRRGQGPRGAWCAAAASWWLEEGWARLHGAERWGALLGELRAACPVERSHGARQLWRRAAAAGRIVDTPAPGDLVLWDRGRRGVLADRWKAHVGIVSRVAGDSWWYLAGNEGRVPAAIAERPGHGRRLEGFARLP